MDNCTKKAEHLQVDPPVVIECGDKSTYTQNWVVISFISPEDRIKQRFFFEANKFLYHDVNKQLMDTTINVVRNINTEFKNKLEAKIAKYNTSEDPVYRTAAKMLEEVYKQELPLNEDNQVNQTIRTYRIDQEDLSGRYEAYKIQNDKELESDFNRLYSEQTSVRGFKVRGSYDDVNEAKLRAKYVRQQLESAVHTFIAPVGYWCGFDPNADAVQDQDYMIPELNNLMAEKKLNAQQRDDFFEKEKQMKIDGNIKSNENDLKKKLTDRLNEQKNQRMKK